MLYLVTYDLNKANKNYDALFAEIKRCSLGDVWCHYLDSTWIIKSNLLVQTIAEKLRRVMDNDDNLLVIELKNNSAGWLPQEAWDYIKIMFN